MDMDDDDDAWSYSFPPSTDSLPIGSSKEQISSDTPTTNSNGRSNGIKDSSAKLQAVQEKSITPNSKNASLSSISLQPAFLQKSAPAEATATMEDASSYISKESGGNALFEESLHSQNLAQNQGSPVQSELLKSPRSTFSDPSMESPSPKVIAYRKSKRVISEGNFDSIMDSPTSLKEKYDPKLYVDEMFKDTSYRYATMKRNTDFHQLFRSLDLTDRLIDDFSCALSREILLQGRIYISENNICFNSNLLGWVTNLIIPMEEITGFEKRTTAGLFPNGITIEAGEAKHVFASFLSRDATFEFMKTVREETTGRALESHEESSNGIIVESRSGKDAESIDKSYAEEEETSPKISSYIMSLDGDDDDDVENDDDDEDDDDEDDDVSFVEGIEVPGRSESAPDSEKLSNSSRILKFKEESNYKNMGPDTHAPTEEKDVVREKNEVDLCEEVIDAPVGIVFAILFGSNTSFHRKFLETHDGSEVSEYDNFHPMEDDPTKLERTYTYRRALGYSIGPKSTKCEVSEKIEHLNFADYITVETSTTTPDVPSGNSFSVRTRYVFTWGLENKTNLKVSFYIKWTGKSWIKGVIEKQSLAGQATFFKELLVELRNEIKESTYFIDEKLVKPASPKPKKPKIKTEKPTFSYNAFIKNNIVSVCYLILSFFILLLILQLRMFYVISETNDLIKNHLVINTRLVYVAAEEQQSQLWSWVKGKYGKDLSPIEKIEFLTYQLNALYQNKREGSDLQGKLDEKLSDIKQSVKDFNYEDYLNVDGVKSALGNLI
ncbi:uncharacterized protein RJT20DRAFT_115905 [Scheffersomyces xylosifermentans]|uniref:uncharacterized protein n=1 Tax=Scheffersomyces xylosifermentans TaxID=1304137 RepID=UPI00315D8187